MKLISINIEDRNHLGRVLPFVEKERPDTLCLQEVLQPDLKRFEALGYMCSFLPMTLLSVEDAGIPFGIAICTRQKSTKQWSFYYHRNSDTFPLFNGSSVQNIRDTMYRCVLGVHVDVEGEDFNIATTHFTWTPDGMVTHEQENDLDILSKHPSIQEPHILCGDFNVPRDHNSLYMKLSALYTDNIPREYSSSLDRGLHRLGSHPERQQMFNAFMVDYVLSKPPYIVSDVRLEFGISDHAAIVATITKATT